MFNRVRNALIVAAVVAATAFSAQAASAFPAGDTLYAIAYDTPREGTLKIVNPSTAATTIVGTAGTGAGQNPGLSVGDTAQGAYNPNEPSKGYWIFFDGTTKLASVNLATGTSTVIGPFGAPSDMVSIAIGADGSAYGLDSAGSLFSVNLLTGAATLINTAPPAAVSAFAFNPADSTFYAVTASKLWSVNTTTGVFTQVQTGYPADVRSISFDADGVLWGTESTSYRLFTTTVVSNTVASISTVSSTGINSQSLFIKYVPVTPPAPTPVVPSTPTLANTGINSQAAWAIGALGAVIVTSGSVLIFIARRKKQS
ncbi:hypothetical protein [Aurantimicrobium minutum]|uniref:hypothetical protein n=1 Tax=Aurantimicrobium minutum TaxID=708131 RepID=UPI0024764770|nr:hypothetical protein [Aurantimicrobium minutum]MDH6423529.1 hypothetical protein [Aurantimicrobium minutum]